MLPGPREGEVVDFEKLLMEADEKSGAAEIQRAKNFPLIISWEEFSANFTVGLV